METLEQLWAQYDEVCHNISGALITGMPLPAGALADKVLLRAEIMMLVLGAHYRQIEQERASDNPVTRL